MRSETEVYGPAMPTVETWFDLFLSPHFPLGGSWAVNTAGYWAERLRPNVYVKGPEYANLVLDKTANIFREKALVERHGGRLHFTNGTTFSSTKLAHFLLAAPEASQGDPLLSNDRVLFRDLSALKFTLEQLKGFLAGAARLRVCVIG